MAKLAVLVYPDPRLRNRARSVARVDDGIRRPVDDMLETMYAAPGIGLAATQVNVDLRIVVMDVSERRDPPHVFINPVLQPDGTPVEAEEGCLSVPGIYETVQRPERVTSITRVTAPTGASVITGRPDPIYSYTLPGTISSFPWKSSTTINHASD